MFQKFGKLIQARFAAMSAQELFEVEIPDLYERYLAAFPAGTNPIYKTRTEHDCSCCKQFIRNIGNAVAIVNGELQTVWDVEGAESPYKEVAEVLDAVIRSRVITGVFRRAEPSYGAVSSRQLLENGDVHTWNHFYGKIDAKHYTKEVGKVCGEQDAIAQVLRRGLQELTTDAVVEVIQLVHDKSLYRGEEHLAALDAFNKMQRAYRQLSTTRAQELFIWDNIKNPFARFRNTVIGTLVQDLSNGEETEVAVRSFEAKVAPMNYKRPTALVTPRMIKDAMATITELGIEPALSRRFAKISDVSVNNVLWVNNAVVGKMKGGIEGLLLGALPTTHRNENAVRVSIDTFMSSILPTASSMELLVEGSMQNNFVSLTAPAYEDSGRLFKWNNDFAWSYNGNITDSIKEKVKAAGGNVTNAKLRVSLAWFNFDDLDIHITEPGGNRIYFGNRSGKLDVDMNAGRGTTRTPVENVSWTVVQDGRYKIEVDQFSRRETADNGFVIEIENAGRLSQFSYKSAVTGRVQVGNLEIRNGVIEKFTPGLGMVGGSISQEKWGVSTEKYAVVNTVMYSPNYWDDNAVGNKHWFFMLDKCLNDQPTRGIYNEFLNGNFEKHRKVFELLGDKTKCPVDDANGKPVEQLSGLGFSSTKGDSVKIQVTNNNNGVTGVYQIQF